LKKHLITSILYTLITAALFGIGYPLAVTAVAHLIYPHQSEGSIIDRNGQVVGSALIGQPFTGKGYFHDRPSAAGTGYDADSSSGSNLGPTSKTLIDRIDASVASEHSTAPVPVDLVTASASGLDPDITPAAALYQVPRVARERHIDQSTLETLVRHHITERQFGLLGEPRVNVLELNLALDAMSGSSVTRQSSAPD
jgi:K+-transporting ATPase ATPase C chain